MKKQIAFLSTAALILCSAAAAVPASAEEAPQIKVTVSNAGELKVTDETITLTDADGDGALTVNDALMLTHHQFYGDEGYVTVQSDWGLSIQTLWGVTNGGSYGYTINDAFANSLTDTLKDGDRLYAYVYVDAKGYSDQYSYFDVKDAGTVDEGSEITLTLNALGFDENWAAVTEPVSGAVITINGTNTDYVTDENGQVTIKAEPAGDLVISAHRDVMQYPDGSLSGKPIVPPVCKAVVNAAETTAPTTEKTTDHTTDKTTAAASSNTTAAPQGNNNTVTVAGAKTGDTDAIPALAVAALLAGCTAFMMRREHD
ncbi:MAG: hypothetical protein IJ060_01415 [Oscillospiraceae bacterium]|nr:hypothetical protein [Oscillospiraceae bacterium]